MTSPDSSAPRRTALVTGASSGIGLELARVLAAGVVSGFGEKGGPQAVRPEPEVLSAATFHARDEVACRPPSSPKPDTTAAGVVGHFEIRFPSPTGGSRHRGSV